MSARPQSAHPEQIHSAAQVLGILGQFAVMQLVLAGTGFVRNKIVALRLGAGAFGEIAQIAAVVGTVTTLVGFGMGVGVSRNAARASTLEERQLQLANANGIVLSLAALVGTSCYFLLFAGRLLPLAGLQQDLVAATAAGIFLAAVPFDGLKTNYLALLQGILDVKGLAAWRSLGVIAATVVAVPVVWHFGFIGAAIQYLLLSAFVAVLLGRRCRALGFRPLALRLDQGVVLQLASFGLVSLLSGFAQIFGDTAVRSALIAEAGAKANGLLQAPLVLSQTVKSVVLSSIGSVSLALIASKSDRRDVSAEIERLLSVVVPVAGAALGLLGLLSAPALFILFSREFVPGAALFPFILTADLLVAFVWVVGAPVLAFGDRLLWLGLDLLLTTVRWTVGMVLLRTWGATAVVMGYLAAVGLHLALNLAVYRVRYHLRLGMTRLLELALALALVAALSIVGSRCGLLLALAVGGPAWLGYTGYQVQRTHLLGALKARLLPGRNPDGAPARLDRHPGP